MAFECQVGNCERPYYQKGLCATHYNKARRNNGDPRGLVLSCAKCNAPIIAGQGQCSGRNNYCSTVCREAGKLEVRQRCNQALHIKKKFGLSVEAFDAMRESQHNQCAICSNIFNERPRVDHCHKTGEIRGLLCHKCNAGIGLLRDSREILLKAVNYLTAGGPSAV